MTESLPRSARVLLRALRLPALLDRPRLRWALRLVSPYPIVVLTHRGRRTGKLFRSPLEVIATSDDGEIMVAPLTGERADWYRNVIAGGLIGGSVRGQQGYQQWRRVSEDEAAAALAGYQRAHRIYSRAILTAISRANGLPSSSPHDIAASIPVLALRTERTERVQ